MRLLVTAVVGAAAVLLILASLDMNYAFWAQQAADVATARVLGAVSVAIDLFKATLPLIIGWAGDDRRQIRLIGTVFFGGCLVFSFISAIGFAVSSRGAVNDARETVSIRHAATEADLKEVDGRLAVLGASRPSGVIEEAIGKARQDRRWQSSNQCKDATVEQSRAFCRSLAELGIERETALESERLRLRRTVLKSEIDQLLSAGARREHDPQAGILARLSGFRLYRVQTGLSLLLALLVELGAAFGLSLAVLPFSGHGGFGRPSKPRHRAGEPRDPTAMPPKGGQGPKRLTRSADGQLMIEGRM